MKRRRRREKMSDCHRERRNTATAPEAEAVEISPCRHKT